MKAQKLHIIEKIRHLLFSKDSFRESGASGTFKGLFIVLYLIGIAFLGVIVGKGGFMAGAGLIALPVLVFVVAYLIIQPAGTVFLCLLIGFFAAGLSRYVAAPFGLAIDGLLVLGWLGVLFKKFNKTDWSPLRDDIMYISLAWYGYVVLELGNPEMRSAVAWFYAMRAVGFYQVLTIGLVFMLFRHPKYLDYFINTIGGLSLLGALWGLRQNIFGLDAAEYHWIWVEGHHDQHILHGVLRVFSFYSDAGQFGASQAMMSLVFGILCIGPFSIKSRIFYGTIAMLTFIGFGISGTRGALAVPGAGALLYLLMTKNFKILALGFLVFGSIFYVLKYTFLFQGVEQVRRMRTALDPNDASFLERLKNQRTFGAYLRTRPFGGGVGSAGYWGSRFSPNTLLGSTPTDSYYVKIWAEMGLIGVSFNLFMFGFFLGKGGNIIWKLKNPQLKYKIMALYSGMGGIFLASYGNAVFSQMPTSIVLYVAIPLMFLSPLYDKMLSEE